MARTSEQIKALRARLGLTQQALAVRLGVAIETIKNWESGRTTPSGMAEQLLAQLDARK